MNNFASCIIAELACDRAFLVNFSQDPKDASCAPETRQLRFSPNQDRTHVSKLSQLLNLRNGFVC